LKIINSSLAARHFASISFMHICLFCYQSYTYVLNYYYYYIYYYYYYYYYYYILLLLYVYIKLLSFSVYRFVIFLLEIVSDGFFPQ